MKNEVTVSFTSGVGNLDHNNRLSKNKCKANPNINWELTKYNEILISEDLKSAYERCFLQAINSYNKKQKRSDRKKDLDCYMKEIASHKDNKNGEKLFEEVIIQIGNCKSKYDNPLEDIEILKKYFEEFIKSYPNLYVFNAVLHLDEATPHLHIDFIPLGKDYNHGLNVRNSMSKALEQSNVKCLNPSRTHTLRTEWAKREREKLQNICEEHGLNVIHQKDRHGHQDVSDYKREQDIKALENENKILGQQIQDKNTHITTLEAQIGSLEQSRQELSAEIEKLENEAENKRKSLSATVDEIQNDKEIDKEYHDRLYPIVLEEIIQDEIVPTFAKILSKVNQEKLPKTYENIFNEISQCFKNIYKKANFENFNLTNRVFECMKKIKEHNSINNSSPTKHFDNNLFK